MTREQKLFWISVLYFAEGFPYGVANDLWPVYFRRHGVDLKQIGLMSLLFLPYTLKAAWAPLVDRLGSRQAWIASAQALLGVACLGLLAFDPRDPSWGLWGLLLLFTTLSATQDIAIDGYAVDVATPRESGAINGLRVTFYRAALLASGGMLLALTRHIGWAGVYAVAALICFAMAAASLASPRAPREPARAARQGAGRGLSRRQLAIVGLAIAAVIVSHRTGWTSLGTTISVILGSLAVGSLLGPELLSWALTPRMLPVLSFVILYKVGDAALGRMVKPFWVDRGLTDDEIAWISTSLGLILTIAGGLTGGWFVARKGIFASLLWLGIAQIVSNFGYVAVALLDLPRWGIYSASIVESFCQGLGTTAFLSLLMNLCDRGQGATQYALLSAAFALSRDVAGAFSGIGVETWGYGPYFAVTALLALPAMLLLPLIRSRIREGPTAPPPPEP